MYCSRYVVVGPAVKIFSHQDIIDKHVQREFEKELNKDWKMTPEEIQKLKQLQPDKIARLQQEAEERDLVSTGYVYVYIGYFISTDAIIDYT